MSKIVEVNEKIAEAVVDGYKKIENGVVDSYKKIEDGVVDGNTQSGGMEITRTISIISRGVASDNGGWL